MIVKLSNLTWVAGIFIFVVGLGSCEKKELNYQEDELVEKKDVNIQAIKEQAYIFSNTHDVMIYEMLELDAIKLEEKIKKTNNKNAVLDKEDLFDVIEEVIGVRPIILTDDMLNEVNVPIFNLDVEQIKLSDYAKTEIAEKYLSSVDEIMQNKELDIFNKTQQINKIQDEIINDNKATVSDIENVLTSTETLKGSLILWSNEFGNISKDKWSPTLWPVWKKLAFIAASDALGGVIGYYVGGAITIDGETVYIPPPYGGVAFAVLFSYFAVHYVGW